MTPITPALELKWRFRAYDCSYTLQPWVLSVPMEQIGVVLLTGEWRQTHFGYDEADTGNAGSVGAAFDAFVASIPEEWRWEIPPIEQVKWSTRREWAIVCLNYLHDYWLLPLEASFDVLVQRFEWDGTWTGAVGTEEERRNVYDKTERYLLGEA